MYFGSYKRWRNQRNPYFLFGDSFNKYIYILEHTDIPATTHLGLPNLCAKSSKSSTNRYDIDKWDVKPAEAHVICSRPSYSSRSLVIQLKFTYLFVIS